MEQALSIVQAELKELQASSDFWLNKSVSSDVSGKERKQAWKNFEAYNVRFCAVNKVLESIEGHMLTEEVNSGI